MFVKIFFTHHHRTKFIQNLDDIEPQKRHYDVTTLTLQVRNDAKVDEKIGSVGARDGDGTSPFNVVKYEIVAAGSSEKSTQYFRIDPDQGDLFITDDLTQELFDEYKV